MSLYEMQNEIHEIPEEAPQWLKQCYQIIQENKYEPQAIILKKIQEILAQQNNIKVKTNINLYNKYNTNLLWLAALYGKNQVVAYLIDKFGASATLKYDIYKGYGMYRRITNSLTILAMTLLSANQENTTNQTQSKNHNYLDTIIILAKISNIPLHEIKHPVITQTYVSSLYGPSKCSSGVYTIDSTTPEWLKKQLKERVHQEKKDKTKNIKRNGFFDIKIHCVEHSHTQNPSYHTYANK